MMRNFGTYPVDVAMPFIEKWESFRATPYRCSAGILTVGYGHTGPDVRPGMDPLTFHEAEELLERDLEAVRDSLMRYVNVPVSESQFIALMSLAFNVGVSGVVRGCPKLMHCLNVRDYEGAAEEFLDVVHAGGRVLPGLVRRRKEEAELMKQER